MKLLDETSVAVIYYSNMGYEKVAGFLEQTGPVLLAIGGACLLNVIDKSLDGPMAKIAENERRNQELLARETIDPRGPRA